MPLVDSLLSAIARLDGDALVMHVGEKPFVITTSLAGQRFRGPLAWGQVELSSKALTLEAVSGMVAQLLPPDQLQEMQEYGAIEYELPVKEPGGERFTVVAARGGEDIWIEVRRHRRPPPEAPAEPAVDSARLEARAGPDPATAGEPAPPAVAAAAGEGAPDVAAEPAPPAAAPAHVPAAPVAAAEPQRQASGVADADRAPAVAGVDGSEPGVEVPAYEPNSQATVLAALPAEDLLVVETDADGLDVAANPTPFLPDDTAVAERAADLHIVDEVTQEEVSHGAVDELLAAMPRLTGTRTEPAAVSGEVAAAPGLEPAVEASPPALVAPPEEASAPAEGEAPAAAVAEPDEALAPAAAEGPAAAAGIEAAEPESAPAVGERPAAVVLPLARGPARLEPPTEFSPPPPSLDRLFRLAASRGASTLYIVAQAQPVVRVDGEIRVLDGEPPLTTVDVETSLMALAPERQRAELRSGAVTEWICDLPEAGRVRCMTFRDHRGPGALFRMMPARAISAEQLGLSREVQALCAQPDGLVLIAGPRASGRSTLAAAFVDLINRTRSDHVITLEGQISFVHESRRSFVSQRECRGEIEQVVAAARAALREDPDVLLVEDLRAADVTAVALEAAESGRLVIGALTAPTTTAAIERLIDQFPAERRPQVQAGLAATLRGAVAQVLLRKVGGGRVAARELLLNTPAVAALIAEGRSFQLPLAIESGRKLGCVPLNDALAGFVKSGAIDAAEACRKAADRAGLLALLERAGVDTSFVERLA